MKAASSWMWLMRLTKPKRVRKRWVCSITSQPCIELWYSLLPYLRSMRSRKAERVVRSMRQALMRLCRSSTAIAIK